MVFELKTSDYIRIIFVIVISGLMILSGVLFLSIMKDLNNFQEIFSKSNFPIFIIGLIALIWGVCDFKNILKIFSCNCKSININKDGQFIIKIKRASTIELSIDEIKDIDIKDYILGKRTLYFDVLRIITKSGKTYKLATFYSTRLHDIVKNVKDIIKKQNI